MTYSMGRTALAGTDRTYRSPTPAVYVTDARHAPSGHRTQPSCQPGTHAPSWRTRTGLGGVDAAHVVGHARDGSRLIRHGRNDHGR